MRTHDNLALAAGLSVDPARWREQFDDLMGRIAGRYAPRGAAAAGPGPGAGAGVTVGPAAQNCWTIAEQAGMPPRTECSTC